MATKPSAVLWPWVWEEDDLIRLMGWRCEKVRSEKAEKVDFIFYAEGSIFSSQECIFIEMPEISRFYGIIIRMYFIRYYCRDTIFKRRTIIIQKIIFKSNQIAVLHIINIPSI